MDKVAEIVNEKQYGGSGNKAAPVILRPDWEIIKNIIKSDQPLENIPCKY